MTGIKPNRIAEMGRKIQEVANRLGVDAIVEMPQQQSSRFSQPFAQNFDTLKISFRVTVGGTTQAIKLKNQYAMYDQIDRATELKLEEEIERELRLAFQLWETLPS